MGTVDRDGGQSSRLSAPTAWISRRLSFPAKRPSAFVGLAGRHGRAALRTSSFDVKNRNPSMGAIPPVWCWPRAKPRLELRTPRRAIDREDRRADPRDRRSRDSAEGSAPPTALLRPRASPAGRHLAGSCDPIPPRAARSASYRFPRPGPGRATGRPAGRQRCAEAGRRERIGAARPVAGPQPPPSARRGRRRAAAREEDGHHHPFVSDRRRCTLKACSEMEEVMTPAPDDLPLHSPLRLVSRDGQAT